MTAPLGLARAWIAAWYDYRARGRLDGVYTLGIEHLDAAHTTPLVIAATHLSYWDGPLGLLASHAAGLRPFWAMDRSNLERLPFLRAFGCLPLSRGERAEEDLRALGDALREPGDVLWFFPQGRHRAVDAPLEVRPGVLRAAGGRPIVPCALRMCWREQDRPAAILVFGPPLRDPDLPALTAALDAARDRARAWDDAPGAPARALLAPAAPSLERGWPAAVLAWLTRQLRRATG